MSDLRHALQEAVDRGPADVFDITDIVLEGERRIRTRRRTALMLAGVAAAIVAGLVVAVGAVTERTTPEPPVAPVSPDELGLTQAHPVRLNVAATDRDLNEHAGTNLDYHRYDGVTTDGLILRAR